MRERKIRKGNFGMSFPLSLNPSGSPATSIGVSASLSFPDYNISMTQGMSPGFGQGFSPPAPTFGEKPLMSWGQLKLKERQDLQAQDFHNSLQSITNPQNTPDYSMYGMPDYAQQLQDRWKLDMLQNRQMVGDVLQGSSDADTRLLGALYNNDLQGNQDDQSTPPDLSQYQSAVDRLNGVGIDYKGQALSAGLSVLGLQLQGVGGPVGTAAGALAKNANGIVSSVQNLGEIGKLSKAGVEGLGKAKAGNVAALAGAAADVIGSFMPEKTEYAGDKGNITLTMDSVYDGISDAAMAFGPIGMMVGGIMKGGKLLGQGMNALGGGTDGMCVCTGTKVFTSTGALVNIEDLQKLDGIIGWKEKTKEIVPQTIHDFVEPRLKECLEIVLKNGYILRCSIDHPILSDVSSKAKPKYINGKRIAVRQWKFRRADELEVGNFVGLANNIDYWGLSSISNAYLIGLLIGDGTYSKGNSCRIISADPDTWEYLEKNNLGVLNHCDDSRPEKYNKEVRTYRIIDGIKLMRDLGLVYLVGKNKTLPKNIGEFDKTSVCQLLAGLFDTDGSISVNEDKESYSITLYLSNLPLLEEVRLQLHKLGIFSTIGTRKAAKYQLGGRVINSNESYRLEIHDISSAIAFYNLIPLNISYKKESLMRIYEMLKNKKPLEHNDISGAKLMKIVSITPIGILTVYNLLADNDHTYLALCVITHNTTTDAILGSSFLNLTPIGLINGFGGSKTETITKDEEAFETVGASYTGSNLSINSAVHKSGKKYGTFSQGAKRKANEEIYEARRQLRLVSDIAEETTNRMALRNSMSAINGNRRRMALHGGYDLSAVRAGKNGLDVKTIKIAQKVVRKWQKGGKSDPFDVYFNSLPKNQLDSTDFRVRDYWEFNGRPTDFLEAVSKGMFVQFEDGWHANSVAENPQTGEIEFMKSSSHPSHLKEVDWYNSDDAAEFRSEWELLKTEPYWKYTKKKKSFKEGGVLEVSLTDIPEEFKEPAFISEVLLDVILPEFKEGGKVNVIPDGALHARLHHMENAENLTKKGIPVVSEKEGGELEQLAEIEREELILRLEVTEKLELLLKVFLDEDSKKSEKDLAAIEAGKLLVEEILNNTIDNTNKLL